MNPEADCGTVEKRQYSDNDILHVVVFPCTKVQDKIQLPAIFLPSVIVENFRSVCTRVGNNEWMLVYKTVRMSLIC